MIRKDSIGMQVFSRIIREGCRCVEKLNSVWQLTMLVLSVGLCFPTMMWAQGPHDTGTYYEQANGKRGAALKTALGEIIQPHVQRSYKDLWEDFKTTDVRPDGKIWDMYSGVTNYIPGEDQNNGTAKKEGDNYNREHSMPNSWFNKEYPMYTDLHHMYPTDSWINNKRGNEPFGETDAPTYSSEGGFSKLGPARDGLGYEGTVFEPADEYKGDFARTYFYMVTSYESYVDADGNHKSVSSWNSTMLARNVYPALSDWAMEMLLRWSAEDPVSEKELNRNEAVWGIQQNRNPFIDYPGVEQLVWGSKKDVAFSYDHYGDPDDGIVQIEMHRQADGRIYSVSGQRLNSRRLPRGVYIRNGKKYVVN